jgi:hypothetical protein
MYHAFDKGCQWLLTEGGWAATQHKVLLISRMKRPGLTFHCGLIGLLSDNSNPESRCFGTGDPDTPRGLMQPACTAPAWEHELIQSPCVRVSVAAFVHCLARLTLHSIAHESKHPI